MEYFFFLSFSFIFALLSRRARMSAGEQFYTGILPMFLFAMRMYTILEFLPV